MVMHELYTLNYNYGKDIESTVERFLLRFCKCGLYMLFSCVLFSALLTLSQSEGLSQIYEWRTGGQPDSSWNGSFQLILQTPSCRDLLPVHIDNQNRTGRGFDVLAMTGLADTPTEKGESVEVDSFIKRISTVNIEIGGHV